jgi:phenylalanyl-tRNA synthetase beta chain
MKISLNWLSEFVEVGTDVAALSHALTMQGLEIEGQTTAAPAMSGVVVAEVRATEKHPDAEKLSVCRVFDGVQEIQIVCGASNVRPGLKVPLATVGARLPNDLQIKQAKLRGVNSFGMLCSAKELGLADESAGLMELPTELVTGTDLVNALQLDDAILEINLTPNRGDCMSVLGVAREVAAVRGVAVKEPTISTIQACHQATYPVSIASTGCGKFVSRVVKGVRADAQSPDWLKERLRRAGVRSISAVVDITNYVMLELGQPMHAYDLNKLQGGLVVRQAKAAEQATLLDGKVISLTEDVLVIADQVRVLGLAGVMGCLESAISTSTTDVMLEVASFEPDAIAGRGRRYGLVTDASQRFERGVDPNLQERAMARASELLLQIAGGDAGPVQVTGRQGPLVRAAVQLRLPRVQRVLGLAIDAERVTALLGQLGMQVQKSSEGQWQITPPSWRFDINIESDLIEEIARTFGYDHIPEQRELAPRALAAVTERRVTVERLAAVLVDRGYQEAITYSFTDPSVQVALFAGEQGLALSNPISAELGVMRLSLWPGLVQAMATNLNRQQTRVRLFETGRLFSADGQDEQRVIAGLIAGSVFMKQWASANSEADFYDAKADVEALLGVAMSMDQIEFRRASHPALHPGQSARILRDGEPIGWLGTLSPTVAGRLDIDATPVLFELEMESATAVPLPVYSEISKFPAVRRDLAIVVDDNVSYQEIRKAVQRSAGVLLKELTVFDVYRGGNMEKGKKSMALGLYLQDTSRTLTDVDVDATLKQVVGHLVQRFTAQIRDK